MSTPATRDDERFRVVYTDHARAVLGYALRRVAEPEDAADVVAETFLVALRRLGEVPDEPRTRAWLYGVARRVLANQRRGRRRREDLGARLRAELTLCAPDPAPAVSAEQDALGLLAGLPARDREVLELAAWEGLEPREIAEVLGVSANTARLRLSRARARVRDRAGDQAEVRHDPPPAGHSPVTTPSSPSRDQEHR